MCSFGATQRGLGCCKAIHSQIHQCSPLCLQSPTRLLFREQDYIVRSLRSPPQKFQKREEPLKSMQTGKAAVRARAFEGHEGFSARAGNNRAAFLVAWNGLRARARRACPVFDCCLELRPGRGRESPTDEDFPLVFTNVKVLPDEVGMKWPNLKMYRGQVKVIS